MISGLSNFYRDTVEVHSAHGTDIYGEPITTSAPAVARIARRTRTLFFPVTGKTLTTAAAVYFRDSVALSLNDRITLPGEATPRAVILIEQSPDETGRQYSKAWIQ